MKHSILGAACAGILVAVSGSAQAVGISGQGTWETTLQARDLDGNLATAEAYYDTDLNITWLADANFAQTSVYVSDGFMDWATANSWAASLNPYSSGSTGWRLPTAVDIGNDGMSSELGHLYYVTLGNLAKDYDAFGYPIPGGGLTNTGVFYNFAAADTGIGYWSATEYATDTSLAWSFYFEDGSQNADDKSGLWFAWAVHDGDVSLSAVPVPAAAWLFGSGLLGLVSVARRKRMA